MNSQNSTVKKAKTNNPVRTQTKHMKRHFIKEVIEMPYALNSIKTTMRNHHIPTRTVKIKSSNNTKF